MYKMAICVLRGATNKHTCSFPKLATIFFNVLESNMFNSFQLAFDFRDTTDAHLKKNHTNYFINIKKRNYNHYQTGRIFFHHGLIIFNETNKTAKYFCSENSILHRMLLILARNTAAVGIKSTKKKHSF